MFFSRLFGRGGKTKVLIERLGWRSCGEKQGATLFKYIIRRKIGYLRTTAPNPPLGHSDVARQQVTARVIAGRTGPSLLGPASWGVKLPERAAVDRR